MPRMMARRSTADGFMRWLDGTLPLSAPKAIGMADYWTSGMSYAPGLYTVT